MSGSRSILVVRASRLLPQFGQADRLHHKRRVGRAFEPDTAVRQAFQPDTVFSAGRGPQDSVRLESLTYDHSVRLESLTYIGRQRQEPFLDRIDRSGQGEPFANVGAGRQSFRLGPTAVARHALDPLD
jgi:hypothetical protein